MTALESPVRARCRPLGDLAEPLDVTRAAIYDAANEGRIGGTIRAGRARKVTLEAYEYHARYGYGADIPPAGTAAARAYDRERRLNESASSKDDRPRKARIGKAESELEAA